MWDAIRGRFDTVIVTQYSSHPRALPATVLAQHVRDSGVHVVETSCVEEAWRAAMTTLPSKVVESSAPDLPISPDEDLLVAAGSFYLIAELRELLRSE
jgi:folylpolyglutamate synthase/dihydropteroate synthase